MGGFALGLMITPRSGRENREWLRHSADELGHWVDEHGKKVLHEGEDRLERFSSGLRRGMRESMPDLYTATEHLDLSDEDLMND